MFRKILTLAPAMLPAMLMAIPQTLYAQMGDPAPANPAQSCPQNAALPAELASWTTPQPITAAANDKGLTTATLTPGQAVTATLAPTPDIRFRVQPEKPGGTVSYGGLFGFSVATAGNYRVALGSGAWIDLLPAKGKKGLTSIAHGHGPACSGVRKMVDFDLKPGPYLLQISGNAGGTLPLLVTKLP